MKAFERDDPLALVGVGYPVPDRDDTDREMALALVEEYALTGFSAADIRQLFSSPLYAMPHAIYRRRGSEFVEALIVEVFGESR